MMASVEAQQNLERLYKTWKTDLTFSEEDASSLSAPLLLQITPQYSTAERRVLFLGQETFGWSWDSTLQDKATHPSWSHPSPWPFQNIRSCKDFLSNSDAVEALCWGYQQFAFGRHQGQLMRAPFWRAFREVEAWPEVSLMWSNLIRMDYSPPNDSNISTSTSIFKAPKLLRNSLVYQQSDLLTHELSVLDPHICLFFTGPYYDSFIESTFDSCRYEAFCVVSVRELARIVHPALPHASFRTYHPRYLCQSKRWHYINIIKEAAL